MLMTWSQFSPSSERQTRMEWVASPSLARALNSRAPSRSLIRLGSKDPPDPGTGVKSTGSQRPDAHLHLETPLAPEVSCMPKSRSSPSGIAGVKEVPLKATPAGRPPGPNRSTRTTDSPSPSPEYCCTSAHVWGFLGHP
jgi:hypothetical protein